ncbi:hypothetical protein [Microbacterium gorillae]|uniref:hypothetical protein n=1 Tax=Microbacterium gorillae TaxID=1231063 RepID=UPI00058F2106|nr:hypothetical protein [Microbacterium gorillae]
MTRGSDSSAEDDALSWAGDEKEPELPRGWRAVGKGAESVETVGDEVPRAETRPGDGLSAVPTPAGNGALLGIGVLAGVYLLYAVGWFVAGNRLAIVGDALLYGQVTFTIVKWAAIVAPIIWYAVVFTLTLHSRTWVRFAWLIAGAVLLIPWPMLVNWQSALLGGTQ